MGTHVTLGNTPLGPSGLVAFMSCGHWWAYPVRATTEQMHEVARFNHRLLCNFCLADWQEATYVPAPGTTTRVN